MPETNPKLTPATLESDQAAGVSPPGAGGWTPRPATPIWIGLTAAVCASLGPVLLTVPIPSPWGAVSAGCVMAIGAGFASYLASKSAGPRKVQ